MSKDENGSDGVNVLLNLSRNTLLVEFVLLDTASVGQSRRVEDPNLGKGYAFFYIQNALTYHYVVLARKFVKTGQGGLTLVAGTTWLVAAVEDSEVVVINVIADKDIGDKFYDCGLANTSLSNKKDGVWRLNRVLRCLDDPLLERLYVAMEITSELAITGDVVVTYLIVGVLSHRRIRKNSHRQPGHSRLSQQRAERLRGRWFHCW
jgi:hypothetical protein